jgi:hypothetical protein
MKSYLKPLLYSHNSIGLLTAHAQSSFLNGQEMAVIANENFCGQVIFPDDQLELCLNGTEDISSLLQGLIVSSTLNGNQTISSCSVSNIPECPGTRYICTITNENHPVFEHVQCITSISDEDGNIISCDSNDCSPTGSSEHGS